jgi:hypothetical protein
MIESVIILNHGVGFVAELRFKNKSKDCSISADTHEAIYEQIQRKING